MIFCYSESFPLGKGWGPLFEQTWIPFTQGYFVPSLVEIGPVILMKKIFQNFVIISTWKRAGPFIWTSPNNALYQVLSRKLARGSEEHFLKFVNVFSLFCYIPLEGGALHLNKLESTSPKDALCQVWLKLVCSGEDEKNVKRLRQRRHRRHLPHWPTMDKL